MGIRSLRFKINAAIFVTSVVVAILYSAVLYPFERQRYNSYVKRVYLLLDTVYRQRKDDLANELFAKQKKALEASLRELLKVEGIVAAAIYSLDGSLFVTTDNALATPISEAERRELSQSSAFSVSQHQHSRGRSLGVYTREFEVIGVSVGFIRFYYDFGELNREMRSSVIISIVLLVWTLLLLSVLLNLLLSRLVVRPIFVLRNALHRLQAGHLGEKVQISAGDEIGDVGLAFNDMSTELGNSQVALQQAEEKYRSIFENAIEGIYQSTPGKGRYLTVNPSMVQMLGYQSREELIGEITDIGGQLYVKPEDHEDFERELLEKNRVAGFETQYRRKDGSAIWVSVSARGVFDESGAVQCYDGSFVDVTERRSKEQAERAREAAEAASKAKSEFLTHISHEIRTPMNAILGLADLLDSLVKDPQQKDYLEAIQTSGKNLMALINDILDLSKVEAGKMKIRREPVSLRSLFKEIESIFSLSIQQKGLKLITAIGAEVPDSLLLDEARLRQVILNLIGNAMKFTDAGWIKLEASKIEAMGSDGFHLLLAVEDTGMGIQPGAEKEIFETFIQQSGQDAEIYGGTGLGLAITKSLVEMMGGTIAVSSTIGKGSVFEIRLPNVRVLEPVADIAAMGPVEAGERPFLNTTIESGEQMCLGEVQVVDVHLPLNKEKKAEILSLLEGEMMGRWESVCQKRRIAEIEDFGRRIKDLGQNYGAEPLLVFAKTLLFHVSSFDIENIQKKLDAYPDLVQQIRVI